MTCLSLGGIFPVEVVICPLEEEIYPLVGVTPGCGASSKGSSLALEVD